MPKWAVLDEETLTEFWIKDAEKMEITEKRRPAVDRLILKMESTENEEMESEKIIKVLNETYESSMIKTRVGRRDWRNEEIEERRGNCHRLQRKKTRMNRRPDVDQEERQEVEAKYRDARKKPKKSIHSIKDIGKSYKKP